MRTISIASFALVALACSHDAPPSPSAPATAPPSAPASTSSSSTASASAFASSDGTRTASATSTGNGSAMAGATSGGASTDAISTSAGTLTITPLMHASMLLGFGGKTIAIDPAMGAVKSDTPKADYVFITDIHPDHLDPKSIDAVAKPGAILVGPPAVDAQRKMTVVLANGASHDFGAFNVEAVPMYNLQRGPSPGKLFHDKGRGDGYVFTFGDKRVYVSGDTECTPEMKALKNIDVAFVCMNLPYTMPPDEAAACVNAFKPKIVYPYHYRGQDPAASFAPLVHKESPNVDVRIRDWYAGGAAK